jgi:hypothetical protein
MLNSTCWLYAAEFVPIGLRSKVVGLAAVSHFVINVAGMSLGVRRLIKSTNILL